MDQDAIIELVGLAGDASGLLTAMAATHAAYLSADQQKLMKDTASNLRAAVAKLKN